MSTNAAILTPAGRGAVAVIAIDGPQAAQVVEQFLHTPKIAHRRPLGRIIYGRWGNESRRRRDRLPPCNEPSRNPLPRRRSRCPTNSRRPHVRRRYSPTMDRLDRSPGNLATARRRPRRAGKRHHPPHRIDPARSVSRRTGIISPKNHRTSRFRQSHRGRRQPLATAGAAPPSACTSHNLGAS